MDEEGISDRQDGFFAVFPYIDTIAGSEDIPVDCLVHQSERRQFTSSGVEDTKPFVVNGQEQFAGGIVCYGENLLPLCGGNGLEGVVGRVEQVQSRLRGAYPNLVALGVEAHDGASDRPFAKTSALLGIATYKHLVECYQAVIDDAHHHITIFIAIELVHQISGNGELSLTGFMLELPNLLALRLQDQ